MSLLFKLKLVDAPVLKKGVLAPEHTAVDQDQKKQHLQPNHTAVPQPSLAMTEH